MDSNDELLLNISDKQKRVPTDDKRNQAAVTQEQSLDPSTHHSIQDTLCSGLPGVQRHPRLLQQLLVHHLDLGFSLDSHLQTVETLVWSQLEGVDLSGGHVQDVDDLEKKQKTFKEACLQHSLVMIVRYKSSWCTKRSI